jgi:hypothetical protein
MSEDSPPRFVMFKLAAGSPFIIAEVLEEEKDVVHTLFPLVFSFQDAGDDDGSIFVNTSKFMHFAVGDVIAFNKNQMYAFASPKQSLIDYYVKWRMASPQHLFEKTEQIMLDSAFDPNVMQAESLNDSKPEIDLEITDPASPTIH